MRTYAGGRRTWAACVVAAVLVVGAAAQVLTPGALALSSAPSLEVVSPKAGDKVTTDNIHVQVKISNYKVDCLQSGRPDKAGEGHIHAMVDGMTMASLANFYCADKFTISGVGLTPGKHKLIIDLASNTHADMMDTAQEVEIDFQPANPKLLPTAEDKGQPGVELVSPKDGSTVDAKFTVEVKAVNFEPSTDLEGKQNVSGYGHYHVFVDTQMGMMEMASPEAGMMASPAAGGGMAMMSMAGMVLMPGTNKFDLDLTAWGPGKHTIWIEPVQDDHTTFETFGHVEFTVTVK